MASRIITKKGSGAPLASDLVHGELAVDTVNKRLYTENAGGTVIEVGTAPSTIDINAGTIDGTVIGGSSAAAITGTTITGTSFVSSGDMTFGDNDKAIFGAGSDLQIYHDGSNSYISDTGTGNLNILANEFALYEGNGTDLMIGATPNGAVTLSYNASTKLATTATGIDVTGTVTADGLVVANTGAPSLRVQDTDGTNQYIDLGNNGGITSYVSRNNTAHGSHLFYGHDGTTFSQRFNIASNGDISFYEDTGTTAKLFWDASAESLTLSGSGAGSLTLDRGASGNQIKFANAGTTLGYFGYIDGTGFSITGSDGGSDVVVDSAGNLLVGKTSAALAGAGTAILATGTHNVTVDGDTTLQLNRLTSNGTLATFFKDGATVGGIGVITSQLAIGAGDSNLFFMPDDNAIAPTNSSSTGGISDGVLDLGRPARRFNDIYATNGTIQTSDRNEKQDIEALSEAETRVAVACKGLLRKFRWKSAVEEKGDDARIHFGIIAQDLQAAFEAEGLDAGRYAMFIHSTWTDEETGEERSRMGVRYSELLAFIIAAI